MRLLVLGGTVFVGRATVEEAVRRGWSVTVFHRGRHGEAAVPDVEHVHGDRTTDLGLLGGRSWDAVVDTCAFSGPDVAASAAALADAVERYALVSSVSAYKTWPADAVGEDAPLKEADDEDTYGAGKVAAERAAEAAMPGRVLITRPGLIVGPYENIGRLPYWLRRVARGGEVLAPGRADEARQWVDARDLAEFTLDAVELGRTGAFNTISPPDFTMGDVLDACVRVTGSDATLRWVDGAVITAAGIAPWTELPLWLWDTEEDVANTWRVDVSQALAAGWRSRPVVDTVRDTWEWLRGEGAGGEGYRSEYAVRDLDPERERAALAAAG